ncbi:MAG: hypothetical protein ACRD5L_10025 [Bryobacteraceae bacterium]
MVLASLALLLVGLPAFAQNLASDTLVSMEETATAPAGHSGSWGVPEGRTLLPHNWLRGYVDFSAAAPHNEPDLGRCYPVAPVVISAGGANSNCNAYARYLLGGYMEIQPFGKTFARHAFVFFTPTFSFGNNVPQFKYTASMSAIAFERSVGIGLELPLNFEIRVTQHQVDWLGKYSKNVGLADLGTSGPYGLYTTVGARWYFGGYGRSHEAN